MKMRIKYFLFTIIALLLSSFSSGQSAEVRGRITDANNNEAVPFANIIVVGTNKGTISNTDGSFQISGLEPGYIQLKVSFIGYKTKSGPDIFVSNNNIPFIEISLEISEEVLSEVVVGIDPFEKKPESP